MSFETAKQLLMPTIFGLNNSFGKKVVCGFEVACDNINRPLQPVVRIVNNNDFFGVTLHADAWENIVGNFNTISTYFDESEEEAQKRRNTHLEGEKYFVYFTISYSQRAVIIEERKQPCGDLTPQQQSQPPPQPPHLEKKKKKERKEPSEQEARTEQVQQMRKKVKFNYPSVVLQANTFVNLKNLSDCINTQMQHLKTICGDVNKCKDKLAEEIDRIHALTLPDDVHASIVANRRNLVERCKKQLIGSAGMLLDEYSMTMVLLELTTLNFHCEWRRQNE